MFEDALVDPVGGSNLEVYLAYVTFCRGRGKMSNAQKVFVRALTQDCALHNPPFHEVRFLLPGLSSRSLSVNLGIILGLYLYTSQVKADRVNLCQPKSYFGLNF